MVWLLLGSVYAALINLSYIKQVYKGTYGRGGDLCWWSNIILKMCKVILTTNHFQLVLYPSQVRGGFGAYPKNSGYKWNCPECHMTPDHC